MNKKVEFKWSRWMLRLNKDRRLVLGRDAAIVGTEIWGYVELDLLRMIKNHLVGLLPIWKVWQTEKFCTERDMLEYYDFTKTDSLDNTTHK